MNTIYFRAIVICLLLASFLTVQADLPVAQAAVERTAAVGERCNPHKCCCSLEARQAGKCCCASRNTRDTGYGFHTARCTDGRPQGDAPIVVKFQVVLPILMALVTRDTRAPALTIPTTLPAPNDSEPPDPPPRLFSNV